MIKKKSKKLFILILFIIHKFLVRKFTFSKSNSSSTNLNRVCVLRGWERLSVNFGLRTWEGSPVSIKVCAHVATLLLAFRMKCLICPWRNRKISWCHQTIALELYNRLTLKLHHMLWYCVVLKCILCQLTNVITELRTTIFFSF